MRRSGSRLSRLTTFPFTVLLRQQLPGRPHGSSAARALFGDEVILGVSIMDINTALHAIDSKDSSEVVRGQAVSGDVTTSAEELAALLRRGSEAPTREIEKLINQLQRLRTQLQNPVTRIQRHTAQYTQLSQQTIQLTAINTDSVKKLPEGSYR